MKVIHLLIIGLIGFIVYRLTMSVQPLPPAPETEPRPRVEIVQVAGTAAPDGAPVRITTNEAPREPGREKPNETESLLRMILQKLATAAPSAAPPAQEAPGQVLPGQPPVASAPVADNEPAQVPPSLREQMRISHDRRLALTKQHGPPKYFRGIVRRHMDADTILVKSGEVGECIVDEYVPFQRMADGGIILFEAFPIGTKSYTGSDGQLYTAHHMIFAAPPLPMWDKYGKPINRDVLSPEAVKAYGLHSETMLDKKR